MEQRITGAKAERAVVALLCLVLVVMNPWGYSPGGYVKDACIWAVAGACLFLIPMMWRCSASGAVPPRGLATPALLWLALVAASTVAAPSPAVTAWAALNTIPYAIIALAVYTIARRGSGRRRLIVAWAASAGVISLYALVQHYGVTPFPKADEGALARASGTLGNPTFLAAFLAAALPFALCLCRGRRMPRWAPYSIAMMLGALAATYARAAWVAGAAGILVTLWAGWRGWAARDRRRIAVSLAAGVLLASAVVTVDLYRPDIHLASRYEGLQDGNDQNWTARMRLWGLATRAVKERPLLGWGPDGFRVAAPTVEGDWAAYPRPLGWPHINAHNEFFTAALDGGLLGLFAWGAVVLTLASAASDAARRASGTRRLQSAAAYGSVVAFVVQGMATPRAPVTTLGLALCWGIVAAMTAAGARHPFWSAAACRRVDFRRLAAVPAQRGTARHRLSTTASEQAPTQAQRRQAAALQNAAIVAARVGAVACLFLAVSLTAADVIGYRGIRAQREGRLAAAEQDFRIAARVYPMELDYRRLWGEAAIERAEKSRGAERVAAARSAADAFRINIASEPHNGFWRAGLAQALSFYDVPAARRDIEEAVRLYPHSARIAYVDSVVYRAQGRSSAEMAMLHAAAECGPTEPEPYIRLAEIFREQGRPDLSDTLLTRAAGMWKNREDLAPWRSRAQAKAGQ